MRPMMSPIRLKKSAPNGRAANPAAKVASVESTLAVSLPVKNCGAMTAVRLPKM
ncbi:MAG: hypothetical protein U0232_06375 [Thermomicrobiales bacterium]